MACNVPRQVGATYKGLWTKVKKNTEARRLGYTKKRFKGLDKPPKYVSPTLTYNLGRDYSLSSGQAVSLLTLAGRIHLSYQGWSRHVAFLQAGATIGAAKLWFDRGKQRFYLLVSLTVATPDPTPTSQRQIVGIDVGQRYLATVAIPGNGAQFYRGRAIRHQADHYARLQKRLQRKGTRSATRRRIALGQRERRLAEYQPRDQ
jgi:transposase